MSAMSAMSAISAILKKGDNFERNNEVLVLLTYAEIEFTLKKSDYNYFE